MTATLLSRAIDGDCPDGALIDINLLAQDGLSISASLSSACPAMSIVLTSSETDDVSASDLASCGARAFISKTSLVSADLERLFSP